jgi:hypothetical protein
VYHEKKREKPVQVLKAKRQIIVVIVRRADKKKTNKEAIPCTKYSGSWHKMPEKFRQNILYVVLSSF